MKKSRILHNASSFEDGSMAYLVPRLYTKYPNKDRMSTSPGLLNTRPLSANFWLSDNWEILVSSYLI